MSTRETSGSGDAVAEAAGDPDTMSAADEADLVEWHDLRHVDFVPVPAAPDSAVSRSDAMRVALEEALPSADPASARVLLGTFSRASLGERLPEGATAGPGMAEEILAWVITFRGTFPAQGGGAIQAPGAGEQEVARPKANTEWNVVIDAETGAFVMAFWYK